MSGNPYPNHGFENDEQWAEREASFCDQMVSQLSENVAFHSESAIAKAKLGRPNSDYSYLSTCDANKCAIMASVWGQMADHLRRPRIARIENSRAQQVPA